MKLQQVSSDKINRKKWDETVRLSPNGLVYHLSFYLDIVSEHWEAFIAEDYSVIVPITFKKLPGIKIAYQPFFSRQQGILSLSTLSDFQKQELINEIYKHYSKFQFCCDLLVNTKSLKSEVKCDTWFFQELHLDAIAKLRKKYSLNATRILKKKLDSFTISVSKDTAGFIRFFKKEKEIVDLTKKDYDKLQLLLDAGIKNGLGQLFKVQSGNACSYGYFWKYKDRVTYLKGTVNEEGKKTGAMYVLMDAVIEQSCNEFSILDFGGSRLKSIAAFFYKFNAKDVYYSSLTSGKLPLAYRILKKTKAALKR